MLSPRLVELERKTILVQFVGVEPLTFYSTADGTDLVQDILRAQLARSDADIFGQEGSLALDEHGEFLRFEPTDRANRTLHLPVEHLAYSGALRRMRAHSSDSRKADQIYEREFENVDLANRYPQHIVGPPIFVSVFHGFDRSLAYTFLTQSADDACLLVMKLIRTFRAFEQRLADEQHQQQIDDEHLRQRQPAPAPAPIEQSHPLVSVPVPHPTNVFLSAPPPAPALVSVAPAYRDELLDHLLCQQNYELVDPRGYSSPPILCEQPIVCAPARPVCHCSSCLSLSLSLPPCSSSTVYLIDPSSSFC